MSLYDTYDALIGPGCIYGPDPFGPGPAPIPPTHVLPTEAAARKAVPVVSGVLDYFPDAIAEVARVSKQGNDQHNPGQPLHWSKHKSTDHADCLGRHLMERGTIDTDGQRHSAKAAWRALALLQTELEAERACMSVREYINHLKAQAGEQ